MAVASSSPSISSTSLSSRLSAMARLMASVVLLTPPLMFPTARIMGYHASLDLRLNRVRGIDWRYIQELSRAVNQKRNLSWPEAAAYKGLGELLLMDALERALIGSREVASLAVVADAKAENAVRFYAMYDLFHCCPSIASACSCP